MKNRFPVKYKIGPAIGMSLLLLLGCGSPARPVQEVSATGEDMQDAAPIKVGLDDWPWWRGPNRNNVANSETAPTEWSTSRNVTWKTTILGRGHGDPTIVGDRIFLATADERSETQMVLCFDRNNGEKLWETVVHTGNFPGQGSMHPKSTHANGSVACDGSSLFIAFLNGEQVTATSLTLDGEIRWQTELGYFVAKFGYAPSPCLYESLAIFSCDNRGGGFLAAIHRDSGDIVWKKKRENVDTYSSAIVADLDGGAQLIISGDDRVASYDPATGEEVWSCPGTAEATCGTVVWHKNLVFASGGYPARETVCVDTSTGQKVWYDNVKCYEQSMLVADGYLYGVTDDGIAMCWKAETGDRQWRERLAGPISASPVLVGDLIYATNEAGTTWVFEATSEKYQQVAKNQLGDEAFASLVVSAGQIFARVAAGNGAERQEFLYCLGERNSAEATQEKATD